MVRLRAKMVHNYVCVLFGPQYEEGVQWLFVSQGRPDLRRRLAFGQAPPQSLALALYEIVGP